VAVTVQSRAFSFLACSLVACGGGDGHDLTEIDAPSSTNVDATVDGAQGSTTVYAIPLTSPTGVDQGSLYSPTLTASGRQFLLDLDTGSSVTGIAGTACTTCSGVSPLYMPGSSATGTGHTDQAAYADGSGWSGEIYSDTVGLAHGTPTVSLDLVDIKSQSTHPPFFFGNEYQGILGLGPAALLDPGTTAYFDQVTAAGVTATMAFELCPTDGTMWLGGYDTSHAGGPLQYTPLLSTGDNADFYSVNMTTIAFGATDLGATATSLDNPIIDTGTSLFYIPSNAETNLIKAINANAAFKALFPNQKLTDPTNSSSATAGCVNAASGTTGAMIDHQMPKLAMTFAGTGGASITLDAPALASYFYDAGGGQYCLAIYGGGDQGQATLGDTFIRGFITVIDVANKRVGFAPTTHCAAPMFAGSPHGRLRERGRGPHHVHASRAT
jgi:hypothetical protein